MCCLKYENDEYETAKKEMPDVGTRVSTPDGDGRVVSMNILERVLKVRLAEQEQTLEYALSEIMDQGTRA